MMKSPWVMAQNWRDLVFLHWPVPVDWLRACIPQELEIDVFEGEAWIGIVPFIAEQTRPRFLPPVPGVWSYRELNVRTYVSYRGKQGVFFFSLDADNALVVNAAGAGGFLPYRHAWMKFVEKGDRRLFLSQFEADDGCLERFRMGYTAIPGILKASVHEQWLTERYCLWTKPKKALWRVDIEHTPWQLQDVHIELAENSLGSFMSHTLGTRKPLAHYSAMQKVRFYPPVLESDKKADHIR